MFFYFLKFIVFIVNLNMSYVVSEVGEIRLLTK